jgi:DNA-binding transcriptional LysR family regulator
MSPIHLCSVYDAAMHESDLLTALAPRLRQFTAVARTEHMTRAADAIGVPQPTLSRGIARLEQDLGVALFVRAGRAVRLTRAGRTLLRHAERALAELDVAAREIDADADAVRGRVALGFLHTFGAEAVPRLLREFRSTHPDVRFDLAQGGNDALLERLRSGEVDVCVTSPLPTDPVLVSAPLYQQELRLVVPVEHPLAAHRDGLPLAAAAGAQFVGYRPGFGLRSLTEAWCREAGFAPRMTFEGEDGETLRGLVGAGLGVALLAPSTHQVPGVVELPVTEPRTTRTVGMVWVADRAPSPAVEVFRSFLHRWGRTLLSPDGSVVGSAGG